MHTFVARQPIFNKSAQTIGYELLFRDGERNAFPAGVGENRATYRLIVESYLSMGRSQELTNSRCFINFPYDALIRDLPMILPKEQIVVEVLESCEPTPELLEAVRRLNREGYVVALDDFIYDERWQPFIPYVHIIKLDIMHMGLDEACDYVQDQKALGVTAAFLAERVETQREFELTREAGFRFFQGFFFSKPEVVKQKYISPEQALALELIREVMQPEVDYQRIERIIEKDLSLSYKLLRFVNASPRINKPITSFKQALVYLGQEKLKLFVSLAVASFIAVNKPEELYSLSMQRAQFLQLMSRYQPFRHEDGQAFIVGLFSMLDALLDTSLETLVADLPLSDSAKAALVSRQGPVGKLLRLGECLEQADWSGAEALCHKLHLDMAEVSSELIAAQKWSQEMLELMR